MNNANEGGKRNDFVERQNVFGTPESFEQAFEVDKKDVSKGLGEAATSGVMKEIFGEETAENAEDKFELPDIPEMMPAPEIKPLIADGTTEKKLGKIGVSLVGEKVDVEGVSDAVEKIKDLPLYEQSAALNSASAQMLLANFGRMVGNDDIGEIQAEEKKRKAEAEQERAA